MIVGDVRTRDYFWLLGGTSCAQLEMLLFCICLVRDDKLTFPPIEGRISGNQSSRSHFSFQMGSNNPHKTGCRYTITCIDMKLTCIFYIFTLWHSLLPIHSHDKEIITSTACLNCNIHPNGKK